MDPEVLRWADNDGHHYLLDRGSGDAKTAQEPRYNRFKAGHPSGFIEAFANLYTDLADEIRSLDHSAQVKSPYVCGVEQSLEGIQLMESINESSKKNLALYGVSTEFRDSIVLFSVKDCILSGIHLFFFKKLEFPMNSNLSNSSTGSPLKVSAK